MMDDRYFYEYMYCWAHQTYLGSIASEHALMGVPKRASERAPPLPPTPPATIPEPSDTGTSSQESNEQTLAGLLCLLMAGLVALAAVESFPLGWTIVLTLFVYFATAALLMACPIIIRVTMVVLGLIPIVAVSALVIAILFF